MTTRYLLRRLARSIAVLIAVSFLSFLLFELAPGDFFTDVQLDPRVSAATLESLRTEYALDRPLLVKYGAWVSSVIRGDWGVSIASNVQVAPLIRERAFNTLLLNVPATLIAWAIALPLGLWTAASRNHLARHLLLSGVALIVALPDLLVVVLLMALAAQMNLLALGGMTSLEPSDPYSWSQFMDFAAHLALPASALVITAVPMLVVHTRAAIQEVLHLPFIRAARASGIPRRRLLYRHALPAAANPLVSLFGISIGTLLSSSLLVEAVTGWPGLGRLLLEATFQRDYYVVIGGILMSGLFLISGNLLADLLLLAVDPRIRGE